MAGRIRTLLAIGDIRGEGMTGWVQVNGLRGRTSLADRVERDNDYIANWSLTLNVMIVVMTPAAAVRPS